MAWPNTEINSITFENIKKDIKDFANFNTVRTQMAEGNLFELLWKDRRDEKCAQFLIENGSIVEVRYDNNRTSSYNDFLASPYMADLQFTATQICGRPWDAKNFVTEKAKYEDKIGCVKDLLDDQLNKLNSDTEKHDSTLIVFTRGDAGSGKTYAMRNTAMVSAKNYKPGNPLYFYIDAQARSLARIEEAIAYETSRLSLVFQPQALHALTRNRLVIPIIDGFDELIGSGGYAEAFKSLATLLVNLDRQGLVVATGRSSFYDDNIMRIASNAQNNQDAMNYTLADIQIIPWNLDDIIYFIGQKFSSTSDEYTFYESIFKQLFNNTETADLLSKPFYAVKLIEVIDKNKLTNGHQLNKREIIEYIVDGYLEREAHEKFIGKSGKPLISIDVHKTILKELAFELWMQEQRIIEYDTINTIIEYVLEEEKIDPEIWQSIKTKFWSYSFFSSTEDANCKGFENPIYYNIFFAPVIKDILKRENGFSIRNFLDRSLLEDSIIEFFVPLLNDGNEIGKLSQKIDISLRAAPHGSLCKRNAGILLGEMLPLSQIENLEIHDICFQGITFSKSVQNIKFIDCDFYGCKLYNRFFQCSFTNCKLYGFLIDKDKFRLDESVINGDTLFLPRNYEKPYSRVALEELGAKADNAQEPRLLTDQQERCFKVLLKFFEKANNRLQFSLNPDDERSFKEVFTSSCWAELQSALERSGIIERRNRDRSGPEQYLFTITENPDEVLDAIRYSGTTVNKKIVNFQMYFMKI